jgi:sulfur carrier protein ThiS
MIKPETTTAEILVHLVRPGSESQDFQLAEGATVADLLRASGVTTGQSILIDGVPIEEAVTLVEGAVVTIASTAVRTDKPWLTPIPAFQDEELYREYRECLEAHRREAVSEEEPEA